MMWTIFGVMYFLRYKTEMSECQDKSFVIFDEIEIFAVPRICFLFSWLIMSVNLDQIKKKYFFTPRFSLEGNKHKHKSKKDIFILLLL